MYLHCIYTMPCLLSSAYRKISQKKLQPHAPNSHASGPPIPPALHQNILRASPEPRRRLAVVPSIKSRVLRRGNGEATVELRSYLRGTWEVQAWHERPKWGCQVAEMQGNPEAQMIGDGIRMSYLWTIGLGSSVTLSNGFRQLTRTKHGTGSTCILTPGNDPACAGARSAWHGGYWTNLCHPCHRLHCRPCSSTR
jgi:hypothetical protein